MITNEQAARDLTITYISNKYGPEVSGTFEVNTWGEKVSGSGSVETHRLPDTDAIRRINVPTGEKRLFGILNVTQSIEVGHEVDEIFAKMIEDYFKAYERFLGLLENR